MDVLTISLTNALMVVVSKTPIHAKLFESAIQDLKTAKMDPAFLLINLASVRLDVLKKETLLDVLMESA